MENMFNSRKKRENIIIVCSHDQGLLQMMLSLFQEKVDYFPGARGRSIRSGESLLLKFINGVHPSVEQPLDLSGLIQDNHLRKSL